MRKKTRYQTLLSDKDKLEAFKRDAMKEVQSRIIIKYGLQNNEYHSLIVKLKITPPTGKRIEGLGVMKSLNEKPVNWLKMDFTLLNKVWERAY